MRYAVATALLHREQPKLADFAVEDIVDRAQKEGLVQPLRPGVYVHAVQHCVANRPPNPGRYRMLFETGSGRRRLFRKGDIYHPAREGAKVTPAPEDVPAAYRSCSPGIATGPRQRRSLREKEIPCSALSALGGASGLASMRDKYIRRLREGWE